MRDEEAWLNMEFPKGYTDKKIGNIDDARISREHTVEEGGRARVDHQSNL